MASKLTTGLTGLLVADQPVKQLQILYSKILKTLSAMPPDAAYRRHTEAVVNQRLNIVKSEKDVDKIEQKVNGIQVEEMISQAQNELELSRRMMEWRVWEPLVQEAPHNQWKWPIV